jgi:hypothetical protein
MPLMTWHVQVSVLSTAAQAPPDGFTAKRICVLLLLLLLVHCCAGERALNCSAAATPPTGARRAVTM